MNSILQSYRDYGGYLWYEITHPSWQNYFYWLIVVSLVFLVLEVLIPWRRSQKVLRQHFWLDGFYMFFNFFLFSLIVYHAASSIVVDWFNDAIKAISGGWDMQASNPMQRWPLWAVLLTGFVIRDFVQWWTHRLLHRVPRLWEFHKVHHSVQEMGFAAHLRYHWMETVVYRTIEYIPLALLGIGLYDFFVIHLFTLSWGHYNHANISIDHRITGGIVGLLLGVIFAFSLLDVTIFDGAPVMAQVGILIGFCLGGIILLGPIMKYVFNSPEMHIWHHAKDLPDERRYGVNFGLTLAIWDYLFNKAYVPRDGKSIALGFDEVESFPQTFQGQIKHGIL